jgi:hypothetical protein
LDLTEQEAAILRGLISVAMGQLHLMAARKIKVEKNSKKEEK